MPEILHISPPYRLDVNKQLTALLNGEAKQLERLDLQGEAGRVRRGPGVSRGIQVSASASTIVSCGVFVRPDCRRVLVDQSASGVLRAHFGTGLQPRCAGPLPIETGYESGATIQGNNGDADLVAANGQRDTTLLASSGGCDDYPPDEPCDEGRIGETHIQSCQQNCPHSGKRVLVMSDIYCKDNLGDHQPCGDASCIDPAQAEWDEVCLDGRAPV